MAAKPVQVRLKLDAYQALAAYANVHRLNLGGAAAVLIQDAILGRARGLPPASERDVAGFVYIIKVGDLYKIGKAVDVQARIRSLHLQSAAEIVITKHSTTPLAIEKLLHDEFGDRRERGEWFRLSQSDIERARELLQNGRER